jgi:hypothetical protein
MNCGDGARSLRLPTTSPFPKLEARASRSVIRTSAAVVLTGAADELPEMTSDVLGVDAGFAVENVKRDRLAARPEAKVGLAHLVGRMLGQARPAVRG